MATLANPGAPDVELVPSATGLRSASLNFSSTKTVGPGYCLVMVYGDA